MLIRASEYREAPWKNGGGLTHEIAADDFTPPAWRVSIARIDRDGPFSDFSGYDRTIVALDGGAVTLNVGGENITLQPNAPYRFVGEANVSAMVAAPARDLNVMTLRSEYVHDVEIVDSPARFVLDEDEFALIYAIGGAVAVDGEPCAADDTVAIEDTHAFGVVPTTGAAACVIRITPL